MVRRDGFYEELKGLYAAEGDALHRLMYSAVTLGGGHDTGAACARYADARVAAIRCVDENAIKMADAQETVMRRITETLALLKDLDAAETLEDFVGVRDELRALQKTWNEEGSTHG